MIHYVFSFIVFYLLSMLIDRLRSRDVLYVDGCSEPDAREIAAKIDDAYRKAGRRLPIVIRVPPHIIVKRALR